MAWWRPAQWLVPAQSCAVLVLERIAKVRAVLCAKNDPRGDGDTLGPKRLVDVVVALCEHLLDVYSACINWNQR